MTTATEVSPFFHGFIAAADGPEIPYINTLCGSWSRAIPTTLLKLRRDMFRAVTQIADDGSLEYEIGGMPWTETAVTGCEDPRLVTAAKLILQVWAMIEWSNVYGAPRDVDDLVAMTETCAPAIEGLDDDELIAACDPDDLVACRMLLDSRVDVRHLD